MRLQGHRKRRKTIEVTHEQGLSVPSRLDYKTARQYPSMGDMLEELKIYSFRANGTAVVFKCP